MKRIALLIAGLVLVGGGIGFFVFSSPKPDSPPVAVNTNESQEDSDETKDEPKETEPEPTYDLTTPNSLTFIANKDRPLPANYVPNDLVVPDVRLRLASSNQQMKFRAAAEDDLKAMFAAAQKDGVSLVFGSGYRSYELQKQFYDNYVARDGREEADRYSARPGTSEHQTGLSFDVTSPSGTCHLEVCFQDLPEGKWMADNAHDYGFILRYPEGKEAVTGYQYEPWHFRYIGKDLATKVHASGQTLEEYFAID